MDANTAVLEGSQSGFVSLSPLPCIARAIQLQQRADSVSDFSADIEGCPRCLQPWARGRYPDSRAANHVVIAPKKSGREQATGAWGQS